MFVDGTKFLLNLLCFKIPERPGFTPGFFLLGSLSLTLSQVFEILGLSGFSMYPSQSQATSQVTRYTSTVYYKYAARNGYGSGICGTGTAVVRWLTSRIDVRSGTFPIVGEITLGKMHAIFWDRSPPHSPTP